MNVTKQYLFGRNYVLRRLLTRFLLFAMGSSSGPTNSQVSIIEEIRKRRYRILVIDDNERFRDSLGLTLEDKYGAIVQKAESGRLGIEELKAGPNYNLVFTDLFMPNMNGLDTYREARQIEPEVKIVIMSGQPNTREWKEAEQLKDITLFDKAWVEEEEILTKILLDTKGR